MITFVRQLVAVPVRLAAWANSFLRVFDRLKLAEIILFLTRDPGDAANVVSLTAAAKGIEAARFKAEQLFARKPHERIAAAVGWIEAGQARNLAAACQWVTRSRETGCEDGYSILQLELFLSEHIEGYDHVAIINRILARYDLPGSLTRDALLGKARMYLKEQHWQAAESIAAKILRIEENGSARWIKWVTQTAAGDSRTAQTDLNKASEKIRPEVLSGFVALGWLCLGEDDRALEVLRKCRREGKNAAIIDRDLAVFIRDNQYRIAED